MSRKRAPRSKRAASQTRPPIGHTALRLAFVRKRKAMSENGRKFTNRVWKQWIASEKADGMVAQIDALVFDAARRAVHDCQDRTQLPRLVLDLLLDDLISELIPKKPGPKVKCHLGIIGREMFKPDKRPRGRPQTTTPADERSWLKMFYFAKAGLLANRKGYVSGVGVDDVIDAVGGFDALDNYITNGEVARLEFIRTINSGASVAAIKARIYRAKKKHTLDLKPRRKSGG